MLLLMLSRLQCFPHCVVLCCFGVGKFTTVAWLYIVWLSCLPIGLRTVCYSFGILERLRGMLPSGNICGLVMTGGPEGELCACYHNGWELTSDLANNVNE